MSKDTVTTISLTYRNEALGDLIYDDGCLSIERTDERIIIKLVADKYENWMQLADFVWAEVAVMSQWAWGMMREGKKHLTDFPAIQRNEQMEQNRNATLFSDNDPFLYMAFHDDHNWVIYENDDEYLFLYEMVIMDKYPIGVRRQTDALHYYPKDDLEYMVSFLRSWFYRVNGYPEEGGEY